MATISCNFSMTCTYPCRRGGHVHGEGLPRHVRCHRVSQLQPCCASWSTRNSHKPKVWRHGDLHIWPERLCTWGWNQVVVKGGTITGGNQGLAVLSRAHFDASDLIISSVEFRGVEVKDGGSFLKLASCHLRSFSASCRGHANGVLRHFD